MAECGDAVAGQWVAAPASTPFKIDLSTQRVLWLNGEIPVSCKRETNGGETPGPVEYLQGNLVTAAGGAVSFTGDTGATATFMADDTQTRVFQYQRYSGGSVFWETGPQGGSVGERLLLDGQARLHRIMTFGAETGQSDISCVPRGLQP